MNDALKRLIRSDPKYRRIFGIARASRERVTSVYDISSRCNLFCEGCLFYNRDGGFAGSVAEVDLQEQDALFAKEKARGVTYPLMAGAEPALTQDVLRLAAKHWSSGMVHTNGTRKIDPDLPFRLFVSVWGAQALTKAWRGADCYQKSLRMAAADPRAIVNYTINAHNIDDIAHVVQDCANLGTPITFQAYSPTRDYSDYLQQGSNVAHPFIQSETPDDNLVLSAADDKRAAQAICNAIDAHPETVVFTKALAQWVFAKPGIFHGESDGNTAPKNCLAGSDPDHRHTLLGGDAETQKTCGHPSVDCRTCRTYTSIYPGFFAQKLSAGMTHQDAVDFLDAHEIFHILYEGHRWPMWDQWQQERVGVLAKQA